MRKGRLFIALSVFLLAACGQKGPLYLPDLDKLKNKQDAIQSAESQQTESETNTQSQPEPKQAEGN
ncbi:lipoprotein [Paraneptunicella aestuarii]|uniref:LPS translocon maturation chaperone LptM n=1 Tax=Paraneptunicella aestuarii TaxID=2831148 RepID=UPI001E43E21F|nr:lipoprotein [Paraneptunicella aestuarii]UAA38307.1 lipoprotein [Paraneptunicella aestuarii]